MKYLSGFITGILFTMVLVHIPVSQFVNSVRIAWNYIF